MGPELYSVWGGGAGDNLKHVFFVYYFDKLWAIKKTGFIGEIFWNYRILKLFLVNLVYYNWPEKEVKDRIDFVYHPFRGSNIFKKYTLFILYFFIYNISMYIILFCKTIFTYLKRLKSSIWNSYLNSVIHHQNKNTLCI